MGKDLIDEYCEIVGEHTDAPREFIELSGYHLVSNLLGRFYITAQARWGTITPNLWFLLSSIPGRTRRSTVQNMHNEVYKTAVRKFLRKTEDDIDKESDARKIAEKTCIEVGSDEGITDKIAETEETDCFAIMSHEFGGILGKKSRTYASNLDTLFSKLYYGQGGHFDFVSKDRWLPSNQYVTMFAGMQEAENYLGEEAIRQGLLRRILLVYKKPDEELKENWKPPLVRAREVDNSERVNKKLSGFADKMLKCMIRTINFDDIFHKNVCNEMYGIKRPMVEMQIPNSLVDKINSIAKNYEFEVVDETNNETIYKQTLWEILVKMTMVKAIARIKVPNKNPVLVRDGDLEEAKETFSSVASSIDNVLPKIGLQKGGMKDKSESHERIKQVVRQNGGQLKATKLLQRIGGNKSDLIPYIETLIERKELLFAKFWKGKRGRPTKVFFTDKQKFEEAVDKLGARERSPDLPDDYEGPTYLKVDDRRSDVIENYW